MELDDGGGRLAFGIDWIFDAPDGEIAFGWGEVESVRAVRYLLYPGVQVVLKRPACHPSIGRRFEIFTLGRRRAGRILDYAEARGVTVDRRVLPPYAR